MTVAMAKMKMIQIYVRGEKQGINILERKTFRPLIQKIKKQTCEKLSLLILRGVNLLP